MNSEAGRVAAIVLPLTQVALLGAVLYRAYVLDQPDSEFNDLRIILGVSVFGYIGASLFWGGYFPRFSAKVLLAIYAALVVGLYAGLLYWGKKRIERQISAADPE